MMAGYEVPDNSSYKFY